MLPHLLRGTHVICDRYYHSSIAYQSCTGGGSADDRQWITEINRRARRPDRTIVLDVSPKVAESRRRLRAQTEMYDRPALQRKLCAFYQELERYIPGESIVHVDGDADVDAVSEAIWAEVKPLTLGRRGRR
jgi:dTMP kinase